MAFWNRKTAGEGVVAAVLNGYPTRNRVDQIKLVAEDLRRGYTEAMDARGALRDARIKLEQLQLIPGTPPADIAAANTATVEAEKKLREKETLLRILERQAASRFPEYFPNLP